MAYDLTHLSKLNHLQDLARRTKAQHDALAAKVDGLVTAGGEPNKIEVVKVNGAALAIAEKMVDILIATGTENGTLAVNGTDVAVKGLAALAYKAEVTETELSAALKAVIDAKAEASAVEALAGRVTTAEGNITTLNADAQTVGSVDYKIAQTYAQLIENPDEAMNSINELVTWTQEHAEDALALSNQVTANKNGLAELAALVGSLPEGAASATVVEYIAESIATLKIGDYAKTADVDAALELKVDKASIATDEEVTEMLDEIFGAEETA